MKTKTKNYLNKNFGKVILIGMVSLIGVAAHINLWAVDIEAYDDISSDNFISINRNIGNTDSDSDTEFEKMICSLDDVVCPNEKTEIASWYDYSLDGIEWSKDHNTCASRDLKRYSMGRVTNIVNGKSVECYVNDYGPETCEDRIRKGIDTKENCIEREIDLSSFAFAQIADLKYGLAKVKIEQL